MYVCVCHGITESKLTTAIKDGLSKTEIAKVFNCMTNCGSCEGTIDQMLDDHSQRAKPISLWNSHMNPESMDVAQLFDALRKIYYEYIEYSQPGYGNSGPFEAMVDKFAHDKFYNLHYVARKYKELIGPWTIENEYGWKP